VGNQFIYMGGWVEFLVGFWHRVVVAVHVVGHDRVGDDWRSIPVQPVVQQGGHVNVDATFIWNYNSLFKFDLILI